MLLKCIRFHNFRPFIGDQEIKLACAKHDKANVTILLGDNTYGKTTFVLAFIWCLYGESRFNISDSILNKKIENSMDYDSYETAFVEVEFEDDNRSYSMRRTQEFKKTGKGQLKAGESAAILSFITVTGEKKRITEQDDINLIIKSILPLDLSSFFFFEGEKNNEIKKKDLGQAVKTLLGLAAFDNMRTHLYGVNNTSSVPSSKSVMGDYLKRQNDNSGVKAQEEYEKFKKAEEEENDAIKERDEKRKAVNDYDDLIDQINEKLRQAEPSREIQKRRDQIEKEIADCENELADKNKGLLKTFSKDAVFLFVTPFLKNAKEKLEKMNVTDKGIRGIEAKAIKELLARKECLCGCDLIEGSSAYKNVAKYIDFIPPKDVGSLVRSMQESIDETSEKNIDFVDRFEHLYKEITKLRLKIDGLEKEDRALLVKIKEIGIFDTEDLEGKLSEYKTKRNKARERIEELASIIQQKNSEKETAKNNFNMYKGKNEKVQQYQTYYRYAEEIYNWVNRNYQQKEDALKIKLENYISEMFGAMYSGTREIHINEKYNLVMTVDGENVADTGGLRAIQYFSYVGGLVRLAYEIMMDRDQDVDGNKANIGEEYPLVLDAAFSHTDETHTKNIAEVLANSVNQLVLALMKKDWAYAQEGMIGKIGRIYELKKIDETEAHILEVNNGRHYN